jgi:multisubunit Na+/H+ antiporter MnhF subunit
MPEVLPGLSSIPFGVMHLLLGLAMAAMVFRFVAGPTEYDRLSAFECFVITLLSFIALQVLESDKAWVLDFILVMSIVGYLSTVALAQFQGLGELPDPERASEMFGGRAGDDVNRGGDDDISAGDPEDAAAPAQSAEAGDQGGRS